MRIDRAEYRGGILQLKTQDPEAIRLTYGFIPGDYELVPKKVRRSLDANAYCWVLIDKIAQKLGLTKEAVYRNAIRDIGGVSELICIQKAAVETLCKSWESRGIGWQTETMPSKLKGCVNVVLYYGSSVYDSKQMSALIDHLVQDAQALGIETMPPERLGWIMEEINEQ